jgi:c-di-GMP-binding flagellar brake protein YcgR
MSLPRQLDTQRRQESLDLAVSRRFIVSLSLKNDDGWNSYKSRFLARDDQTGELIVEYPSPADQPIPEVAPLQNIGVSFRRGHKKCLFNTTVRSRRNYSTENGAKTAALQLALPANVFELQRRVFYRTPIPDEMTIEVRIWPGSDDTRTAESAPYRGTLLDLSAGGLSFILEGEDTPQWKVNTPITCWLSPGAGEPPIEAAAQFRHCEPDADDHMRVGLQFAGLEASKQGRATLQRILDLTMRLQAMS